MEDKTDTQCSQVREIRFRDGRIEEHDLNTVRELLNIGELVRVLLISSNTQGSEAINVHPNERSAANR